MTPSELAEAIAVAEQTVQNNKYGMAGNDERVVILARALLCSLSNRRTVVEGRVRGVSLGQGGSSQLPRGEASMIDDPEFAECADCAAKPGSPTLCRACLHNRATINQLRAEREELIKVYVLAARLRTFPVPFDDHFQLVGAVDECRSVLEPPVDDHEPAQGAT